MTNKTAEYLSKFPLGKIPSFESATGFTVFEANAIAYYVCENGPRKEQLLGKTAEERALVQQFTFFTSEHLFQTVGRLVRPILGVMPYDEKVEVESKAELERWMGYLEEHLEGKEWMVKGRSGKEGLSYADLAVGQAMRLALKFYLGRGERERYPNVMAWWNRLLEVPEVEEAFRGNVLSEKE